MRCACPVTSHPTRPCPLWVSPLCQAAPRWRPAGGHGNTRAGTDTLPMLDRLIRREHSDPIVEELNPGDALEPEGRGTGGCCRAGLAHAEGGAASPGCCHHHESQARDPLLCAQGVR